MGLRDQVFVSYSHKDKKWLKRLQTHLAPFVRNEAFSIWVDNQIRVGSKWKDEIAQALAKANVAVLLVTPEFIASDFIAKHELPPLLRAAEHEGLTVVWIAVEHSSYEETDIAKYQAANDPSQPLSVLARPACEAALVRIAKTISDAASRSVGQNTHRDSFSEILFQSRMDMLAAPSSGRELRLILYRVEDLLTRNPKHPLRHEAQDLRDQVENAIGSVRPTRGMRREEVRVRKEFLHIEPSSD